MTPDHFFFCAQIYKKNHEVIATCRAEFPALEAVGQHMCGAEPQTFHVRKKSGVNRAKCLLCIVGEGKPAFLWPNVTMKKWSQVYLHS